MIVLAIIVWFALCIRCPSGLLISKPRTVEKLSIGKVVGKPLLSSRRLRTASFASPATLFAEPIPNHSSLSDTSSMLREFDAEKEVARKQEKSPFTLVDWVKHRSSSRYLRYLLSFPSSTTVRGLLGQSSFVAAVSTLIVAYNIFAESHVLGRLLPVLTLPPVLFSVTASSLVLLLVFRTNNAYARWREGRNWWTQIHAKSFDVMRQSAAWITDKDSLTKIVRYLVAFSRVTKWHLTSRNSFAKLQEDLHGVLSDEESSSVMASKLKPQYILLVLTKLIANQNLIPSIQTHIDRGLLEIGAALEGCDRTFATPIPVAYSRLTARFLMVWLLTLPLGLYNEFSTSRKWLIPIVMFVVSTFLLRIDDLGVQLEEPFSVLPLENVCGGILTAGQVVLQSCGIDWAQATKSIVLRDADSDAQLPILTLHPAAETTLPPTTLLETTISQLTTVIETTPA